MAGKNNRACGSRFELEVVKFFRAGGLKAEKHLMSGQLDGSGDMTVTTGWGEDWAGEAKWKSLMPQWLITALGKNKFVVFKQSRGETFVLLRLSDFRDIIQ